MLPLWGARPSACHRRFAQLVQICALEPSGRNVRRASDPDGKDGTWNLLLKACQKFITSQEDFVLNAYFTEYEDLTKAAFEKTPFAIDRQWTPKRRKQELHGMEDSATQASFPPKTYQATPVKFAGSSFTP